jgi:hypothetical protein
MSGLVDAFSEIETDGLADGERPWCDMTFDLVKRSVEGSRGLLGPDRRALSGTAMASTTRGDIGFAFELEPVDRWRAQENDGLHTEWGCITLRSIGEPTDRLVEQYRDWFGLDGESKAAAMLTAPAVVIGGSAARFDKDKLHTKLFLHHENDETTYAEIFLNIDVPSARVELKEKDEEYRPRLVAWLQGACGQPDKDWLR